MVHENDDKNTLYCSFCGKSQHEVKKLIAGPTVFICEECVGLCMSVIVEEGIAKDLTAKVGKYFDYRKQAEFDTFEELFELAGLETHDGPYNGHELFRLLVKAIDIRAEKPAKEAMRKNEIVNLERRIADIQENAATSLEKEVGPLKQRLENLKKADVTDASVE